LETDRVEGYTEPHAVMIARLVETIGRQMGLHGTDLSALKFAALAHDIGERGMKRNYLLSPAALTWEERLDLWRHPILGEQSAAEINLSRQTQLLGRWHHEWWNGQGYPDGLSSEAIPLGARIQRAVDSYCALICARPYRQAYELAEAEQVIADLAGIEFDPQVARLLLILVAEERRQREAEIELQQQQAAVWNIPPQFELHTGDEAEEEFQPDSMLAAETLQPEESQPEVEEIAAAAAYEPVLSFAEAQHVEADDQVAPSEVEAELPNETADTETIPPDQMPTMEFPVVELPKEGNPPTEQTQNIEPDENKVTTESAPQIQN
ncbi:MAG: HD-GYP domain-containing protein, partial [Blastocatellia bacterium]